MKTNNLIYKRINILFFLTLLFFPIISKAQLYVTTANKVGIGTITPSEFLDVVGNVNVGSTNAYQINANKVLWNNGTTSDIFVGVSAGNASMTGHSNTLFGNSAGVAITTGTNNCFLGYHAGSANTSGLYNTGNGVQALLSNTTGTGNTSIGVNGLAGVTTGSYNIGVGYQGGVGVTTGGYNIAIGYAAGSATNTGSNNILIGTNANVNASTYSNAAAFGNGTVVTASNKIFFGNTSVTNIQGQVGFTTYSDGRFKINVTENVKGLEFINKLRPVTYKMDTKALDDFMIQPMSDSDKTKHQEGVDFTASTAIVHSGFIAQEVELAAQQVGFTSSIVSAPSNGNDPYALSYAEIVVPLVKAVQELSKAADSTNTLSAKNDSTNAAKIQALQNQVNQLDSMINACCNSNHSMQQNNNSNSNSIGSSSMIDVNLKDGQSIVLDQNVPNPFAEQTTINYFLPDNIVKAQMLFYNADGKLIQSVDLKEKGKGSLNVFASDLTNGIYTYTLVVDGKIIETKKMLKQ